MSELLSWLGASLVALVLVSRLVWVVTQVFRRAGPGPGRWLSWSDPAVISVVAGAALAAILGPSPTGWQPYNPEERWLLCRWGGA